MFQKFARDRLKFVGSPSSPTHRTTLGIDMRLIAQFNDEQRGVEEISPEAMQAGRAPHACIGSPWLTLSMVT